MCINPAAWPSLTGTQVPQPLPPDDDMHVQLTLPFAPPQLLHSPLAGVDWYLPIGYATNSDEREG
jgi:hypothetical protein